MTCDLVDGADSYTIYYGTQSISEDGASYENNILLGNVNEHILEHLVPDIMYYFAVAADDSTGTYLGSYNYSEEISTIAGEIDQIPEEDPINVEIPEEETTLEVELSVLEDLLEDKHTSATEPTSLPQSGPVTTALALVSGAGAYFWRKFRK